MNPGNRIFSYSDTAPATLAGRNGLRGRRRGRHGRFWTPQAGAAAIGVVWAIVLGAALFAFLSWLPDWNG